MKLSLVCDAMAHHYFLISLRGDFITGNITVVAFRPFILPQPATTKHGRHRCFCHQTRTRVLEIIDFRDDAVDFIYYYAALDVR